MCKTVARASIQNNKAAQECAPTVTGDVTSNETPPDITSHADQCFSNRDTALQLLESHTPVSTIFPKHGLRCCLKRNSACHVGGRADSGSPPTCTCHKELRKTVPFYRVFGHSVDVAVSQSRPSIPATAPQAVVPGLKSCNSTGRDTGIGSGDTEQGQDDCTAAHRGLVERTAEKMDDPTQARIYRDGGHQDQSEEVGACM